MKSLQWLAAGGALLLVGGLFYFTIQASGLLDGLQGTMNVASAVADKQAEDAAVTQLRADEAAKASKKAEEAKEALELKGFGKKLTGIIYKIQGGAPVLVDVHKKSRVKYWAIYNSASWCPPCRAFTPDLVQFYNSFQPSHSNFEILLVGADHSEGEMFQYMQDDEMQWLTLSYRAMDNADLNIGQYLYEGIPTLTLIDNDGNVLANNFSNGYRDPHDVIEAIRKLVPPAAPDESVANR